MKRMAAVLAAVMVMALAFPAFAAIDLNGKVETRFTLNQLDENDVRGEPCLVGEQAGSARGSLGDHQHTRPARRECTKGRA
jgi:hypothetical protein